MIAGGRIHPYARDHKPHMQGGDLGSTLVTAAAVAPYAIAGAAGVHKIYDDYTKGVPLSETFKGFVSSARDAYPRNAPLNLADRLVQSSHQTTGEPIQKKDFGLPTLSILAPPPLVGRSGRAFGPKQLWDKRPGRVRFRRSLKPLHSSSRSKPHQATKKTTSKKRKKVRRRGGALINNTAADGNLSSNGFNYISVQH